MVRITRVYTRKGDKGQTSVVGQKNLLKDSARIVALGMLDELNSFLGFAMCTMPASLSMMHTQTTRIQNELFELGAQLAVVNTKNSEPHITLQDIVKLEEEIDDMNSVLTTLESFVLPGGHELAARLHICRTICRRAERSIVALAEHDTLPGHEIMYLNRLGDWLFVAARFSNQHLNYKEALWEPRRRND